MTKRDKTPHARTHLTRYELADRWDVTDITISRRYRELGLKPIKVCGRVLFPIEQVEETERRSMLQNQTGRDPWRGTRPGKNTLAKETNDGESK